MGLFGWLSGSKPAPQPASQPAPQLAPQPAPVLPESITELRTPFQADPEAAQLMADAQGPDLQKAMATLTRTKGHWSDRRFLCEALARSADVGALCKLVEQLPDNATFRLGAAARLIEIAWKVRGGGTADTVTEARGQTFHEMLAEAGKHLERSAKLMPEDPTPWSYRVEIARCYGDAGEARKLFNEARQRDPGCLRAYAEMASALAPKWGGTIKQLLSFGSESAAAAPEGSQVPSILALARIEHWLDLFAFKEDKAAAAALLGDSAVQGEVLQAARRSVLSPAFALGPRAYLPLNIFAFWFYICSDKGNLRAVLQRLGGVWGEHPWRFRGKPEKVYQRALALAELAAAPAT